MRGRKYRFAEKWILELLKKKKEPVSSSAIARELKISPSTTLKYLNSLLRKKKVKSRHYGNIRLWWV